MAPLSMPFAPSSTFRSDAASRPTTPTSRSPHRTTLIDNL